MEKVQFLVGLDSLWPALQKDGDMWQVMRLQNFFFVRKLTQNI